MRFTKQRISLKKAGKIHPIFPRIFFYTTLQYSSTSSKLAQNGGREDPNTNWQEDISLEDALNQFVRQGLHRDEILDYMARDFPNYTWSLITVDRQLRYLSTTSTLT